MKRVFPILTVFLAVMLFASFALASSVPELRGTWLGPTKIQTTKDSWKGKCALVINTQSGQTFAGYKLWFDKKNVLQKEAFAGIYGDDERLYITEENDGYGFGYLTGRQTMTVNYLEHGFAAKAIVCTLERVHFTTGFVEIDKDGDKVIVSAEITNHYPLNAARIMAEADKDGDGQLTKKEWEAWKKANNWKE